MMVEQAQNCLWANTVNAVNLAWDQGIKKSSFLKNLISLE
ncbi:MAG: hypothetical protein CM15mP102_18100 [Flavobacteriales bacterium]|nr:MAG: hypothetical protein CM15mP102_18100 [Flavobacteriales bacterium]